MIGMSLVSTAALASDSPQRIVEVQGREYAAFVKQGVALALPSLAQATLVRDSGQLPPGCQALDDMLMPWAGEIELCKDPANAGTRACKSTREVINLARFDLGTIGQTALPQGWAVEPSRPTGGPSADDIRRAVATAVGVNVDATFYKDVVPTSGSPSTISIVVKPDGASWASKVLGVVDLSQRQDGPAVTYVSSNRKFVTKDHIVACGILAGDVRVAWRQNGAATVPATAPGPFSAADLWRIYQALSALGETAEEDPIRRAVAVGARIGAALQKNNLADAAQLEPRVRFLLNAFFRGDALDFEAGLSRTEVERRASGTIELAFEPDLNWSSVSAH